MLLSHISLTVELTIKIKTHYLIAEKSNLQNDIRCNQSKFPSSKSFAQIDWFEICDFHYKICFYSATVSSKPQTLPPFAGVFLQFFFSKTVTRVY